MGEIVDIRPDSVAEKCGLRAQERDSEGNIVKHGDVIMEVDNVPVLDPLAFPYQIFNMAGKETVNVQTKDGSAEDRVSSISRSIVLTVNRDGERVDVSIALPSVAPYSGSSSSLGVLACGTLGIAYETLPTISGTDGTVSFDGNPIGGRITGFRTSLPNLDPDASDETKEIFKSVVGKKFLNSKSTEPVSIETIIEDKGKSQQEIATETLDWFSNVLPYLPDGTPVTVEALALDGKKVTIETKVKRSDARYNTDRGLFFGVDVVFQKADGLGSALAFGWAKTVESASQVFVFLKNVGRNVSAKALGGPGMIVGTAYAAAGRNDGVFLLFLCLISANLAVVNFLPIPVLDGGHMVFLLYEAIARRKPNEKVQVVLSYIGFGLILALMFWVIFLDVVRYCF